MTEEFGRDNRNKEQQLEEADVERRSNEEKEIQLNRKPVIINAEAYKTIILYASRYANQSIPQADWKEIYGILTGHTDDDFVYVKNAYPLTFGHDTDVQLDERHYVFISEIEDKLYEEGKGHFVVGWFHSHPGLTLFFSDIDIANQLWFQQNNPDFCGLVFDHTLLGKKKQEKIGENVLTKYDTGFEIYRIIDVNKDPNSPDYDKNYFKVDYVVDGLNKYFFANVLAELASLASAGKPLQSAYGEEYKLESAYKDTKEFEDKTEKTDNFMSEMDIKTDNELLVDIPMSEDIQFSLDTLFYDVEKQKEEQKTSKLREEAEQLIYEGNRAFNNKNTFTGVEKYRQGIKKFKELNDFERVLDLLRNVAKICISNNHLVLAEEFSENLQQLSDHHNNLFYRGVSNYIKGYISLKKGDREVLKEGLSTIRDAAIIFEKVKDYAGAGMSFNKIGTIYQNRLENYDSACLFYREAIENYNKAIIFNHPLRKSLWSKPELLKEKIIELRDQIEELLPHLEISEIRKKIVSDLRAIEYNF
jgi:proteasome lid subunit RPN8/RPN11